jgi:acetoacetyl-CoA synthetase
MSEAGISQAEVANTTLRQGEILRAAMPPDATHLGGYLRWLQAERGLTFNEYNELWRWSVNDLDAFWRSVWDYFDVIAHDEATNVLSDRSMPGAQWFSGATLNYAENALRGPDQEVVVIARSQTRGPSEMTRGELRAAVGAARAGLQRLGVDRGDRVAAYAPNIPETVVMLLATASLGAIWAVIAPDSGTQSVLDRFQQIEPKVLVAIDGYRYGAREVDRTDAVASIRAGLTTVQATIRIPYLRDSVQRDDRSVSWEELVSVSASPTFAPVPFDHPLWVLFSSGTTGLPKAIVHGHGGIVLEALKSHAFHTDLGPGDRYFFVAPTTWVVWNLLVSGLLVGAAVVLTDGNPAHPDVGETWRLVADTGATSFGCGAAFLTVCRNAGLEPGRMFDLSRLRTVSSTGSPLPADGFRWVYERVKPDVYLQSISGGTDVCAAFVGGCPLLPVRAGEIACRCLGINAQAFDREGRPLADGLGELVITEPMPSMPIGFWNDPDGRRYREAYFDVYPGRWRHGDWIAFDPSGSCVITGRSDATLNRGGVRLGTAEFYAALADVTEVTDSLVVHLEDPEGGLGALILFVALAPGVQLDSELEARIRGELRVRFSPRHVPDRVVAIPEIPYNLTGKKLEVPVKRLLLGVDRTAVVSDGALRNPSALDAIERFAAELRAGDAAPMLR